MKKLLNTLRDNRGFTLIELAIVLIVIGIIIGAVLKGQDIVQSSRMTKFVNDTARTWEAAIWTFQHRMGRFPGDLDRSGVVGDDSGDDVKTDLSQVSFINPPQNPVVIGSNEFYVYLGTDGNKNNVLVICPSSTCGTAFTAAQLDYARAMDTAIDGVADGKSGKVLAGSTVTVSSTKWTVTDVTAGSANWTAGQTKAIVYYFDTK